MKTTLATLTVLLAAAPFGSAAITSTLGGCVQISPPAVADFPTLNGPFAQCWDEQQNRTGVVQADLISIPGSNSFPVPGVLFGTCDSHFIHWTASSVQQVSGTVFFNNPVVAVAWGDNFLDLTDGAWGAGGTIYPTGQIGRGINAAALVSAAGNMVHFQYTGVSGAIEIEQLRVWTQVPTPGGCSVAAIGGLAALRRKRR